MSGNKKIGEKSQMLAWLKNHLANTDTNTLKKEWSEIVKMQGMPKGGIFYNYHAVKESIISIPDSKTSVFKPTSDTIIFCKSINGGWVGINTDIDGCMSQGETIDELLINLEDAKQSLIKSTAND
jgi:predicted RNase H-like HicB family nuclease